MPAAATPAEPRPPDVTLFLQVSPDVVRALGADATSVLSQGQAPVAAIAGLVHADERAFFRHAADWACGGQAPARLSLRLARPNDNWVAVLAELRGTVSGPRLTLELDEAAAARRAEAQIRQIVENARQAASVRQGERIVFTNHALAQLLGYESLAEMRRIGSETDHLHPDDRAMVARLAARRAAGKPVPDSYEFRMVRLDGSTIWIDCSVSLVSWNGAPASLAWLIDVTARKRTEEALRRSEKLFHSVFQACPDVLALTELGNGRFVDVNASFLRIHGRDRDAVIGRTERELDLFIDAKATHRALAAAAANGEPAREIIAPIHGQDGEERQLTLSTQVIHLEDRDLLLTVGRDITDRLRVEKALHESREAAVFANRAKSEFLANMSHELRTPLNAIIGFSEVIADGLFGPVGSSRYADYATDIKQSGEHLLQIINDLLDLSKLEAGKQPLHESEFIAAELAEATLRLTRQRAHEAGVTLSIAFPGDMPALHADERLMKQVLINLLSNAVKFTAPGGTVTISGRPAADGGAEITVADTGIGMTAEEIEIALAPFGQVESKVARRHQGTGLGLPLVRALIELHGGSLHVASEPGAGTVATLTLPAERARGAA
jgi:PAS domain S-box-containing protein